MQLARRQAWRLCLTAALVAAPIYAARAEADFDRTLRVSGAAELDLNTGSGSIRVVRGASGQVVVRGHVRASDSWGIWGGSGGDSEARVKSIADNPPIEQDGNLIVIGGDDRRLRNISISYEIQVPEGTNMQLRSGSGSITSEGVGGSLRADSGSGSVRLADASGAMHARTGSGSVTATNVSGDVRIETGSGSVDADNVVGSLDVQTGSGSISAVGEMRGDWKLETGSGGIRVDLPSTAAFSLDAQTGSGTITTEHPVTVQGEISKRKLRADVRGGGPLLRMSSGSGSLRIN